MQLGALEILLLGGVGYLLWKQSQAPLSYAPRSPSMQTPPVQQPWGGYGQLPQQPPPQQGTNWGQVAQAGVGLVTGIVNAVNQGASHNYSGPSSGGGYGSSDGWTDISDEDWYS